MPPVHAVGWGSWWPAAPPADSVAAGLRIRSRLVQVLRVAPFRPREVLSPASPVVLALLLT